AACEETYAAATSELHDISSDRAGRADRLRRYPVTSQPFINETSMSASALQTTASADWTQAQHVLATQTINLGAGVLGINNVPPDPRALTVQA
ncbi:MAG: hypothetical protein ACM34G_03060, partial [Acidobacteriota bacterium]